MNFKDVPVTRDQYFKSFNHHFSQAQLINQYETVTPIKHILIHCLISPVEHILACQRYLCHIRSKKSRNHLSQILSHANYFFAQYLVSA